MARRQSNFRPGYMLLSALIAAALWGIAHGSSSIDRGVDIPVVFRGVPEDLVITGQSADVVNIRVLGSRASLRNVSPTKLEYPVDVSEAKPGPAIYEVDTSRIDQQLPSGAKIVSRSPSIVEVEFERRGRKSVRIRPDVEGQPAEGFEVTGVEVVPPRVWLAGARREVVRLAEVVTETVDISGITENLEREVTLSLGAGHVWMEQKTPVKLRVQVIAKTPPPAEAEVTTGEQEG